MIALRMIPSVVGSNRAYARRTLQKIHQQAADLLRLLLLHPVAGAIE